MKYTYYLTMSLILLSGCHNFISKDGNENQDTFTIDGREYALDTLLISQISSIEDEAVYFNIENLIGTSVPISVSLDEYSNYLQASAKINDYLIGEKSVEVSNFVAVKGIDKSAFFDRPESNVVFDGYKFQSEFYESLGINEELIEKNCIDDRPESINELTAGLSLQAHSFDKDNKGDLGLFGFGKVNIEKSQKVVLVEFLQTGNYECNGLKKEYGIGARLMMKINKSKKKAKINSPQQISASVTFGLVDVEFSIKTVGITGPGTATLVNQGSMTENTYSNFLKAVSNLIVDAYKDESSFIIDPQEIPKVKI